MLTSLKISNYALIDHLAMQPSAGLSMITGETGAGKSIMLGAVGLLLGNRADTKVLLHEEKKCVVEGVFDIRSYGLQEYFEELELDYEDSCIIRREISPNGKSRSFVNDTPILLDHLKTLGEKLMDVHSQHDTLLLGEGDFQLGLVDAFAQTGVERAAYQQVFKEFKSAKKRLEELARQAETLKKEFDFNQFQLNELSSLSLVAGEQEELEASQEILENAEDIKVKIQEILSLFQDEQFGVLQGLGQIQSSLQGLERLAQAFGSYRQRFQEAFIELKDLAESLADEDSTVEVEPEKLERTRERLSKIYQLQKKHGLQTIEELLALESHLADQVFQVQQVEDQLLEAKRTLLEKEKAMHKDFDSVLECSGVAGSTKTSLKILRSGGTAVLVGFRPGDESFELLEFILSEKHLVGTAAHMWDVDVSAAVGLLANKIVDTGPLLTDVISLADVPTKGFDRLISDKNVFKIAVNPAL